MEQYANINGVHLYFTDRGEPDAPPVVLMHGWGCSTATVGSIENAIADKRRVINVDLPGHGKSSEPPMLPDGKPWGVYEYADTIEKLMEMLELKKPALIGHSYGGRIAIIIGSRREVEKIILVDAAGVKPRRPLKYYWKVYSFKAMRKILPILAGRKRAEKIIERRRARSGSADYRQASPVMRMVMSKSVNQDLKKHMPSIKAPTLLIWGENDTATPLSDARTMERLIPDAGLVAFPGAGHYSFLDNPVQFRAVVRNFL